MTTSRVNLGEEITGQLLSSARALRVTTLILAGLTFLTARRARAEHGQDNRNWTRPPADG